MIHFDDVLADPNIPQRAEVVGRRLGDVHIEELIWKINSTTESCPPIQLEETAPNGHDNFY